MKKLERVVNGFLGCGITRPIATFPQTLLGLFSFILPKIFTMKVEGGGEAQAPPISHLPSPISHLPLYWRIQSVLFVLI